MERLKLFLKKYHLFQLAKSIYRIALVKSILYTILRLWYHNRIKRIAASVKKILLDNSIAVNNSVFIFQATYFTKDGKSYISGGGERYVSDLSELIVSNGSIPVLFQLGNSKDREPWINKRNSLLVIGLNIIPEIYGIMVSALPTPKLSIYSGLGDFSGKKHHPNINISHGITWDDPGDDVRPKDIFKLLFDVDALVSVDTNTLSWLRSTFAKSLTRHPINMNYIPNYADFEIFKAAERANNARIRITFPRRCSPERGFWLVIDVLPKILKKYDNVDFEFIGFIHDITMNEAIEQLQKEFPARIRHSFVDASEMNRVYQASDISIIPTLYSEGTSLSCIEAMACGSVVIATNIGGLPNLIIDNYNGILINPKADELLNAIDYLLENPEKTAELRENALHVSKVFSKENWNNKWNSIISTYNS